MSQMSPIAGTRPIINPHETCRRYDPTNPTTRLPRVSESQSVGRFSMLGSEGATLLLLCCCCCSWYTR